MATSPGYPLLSQLGPEFVSEHQDWVAARASYFAKQLRSPYEDVQQAVWEGLIWAYRVYIPGEQSLRTWSYTYILKALSYSRLGVRGSVTVPESTLERYKRLMKEAGYDIWTALDLAGRGVAKMTPVTLHLVHMALQPPMELTEFLRREDASEEGLDSEVLEG
jgi:hypothetical protein